MGAHGGPREQGKARRSGRAISSCLCYLDDEIPNEDDARYDVGAKRSREHGLPDAAAGMNNPPPRGLSNEEVRMLHCCMFVLAPLAFTPYLAEQVCFCNSTSNYIGDSASPTCTRANCSWLYLVGS